MRLILSSILEIFIFIRVCSDSNFWDMDFSMFYSYFIIFYLTSSKMWPNFTLWFSAFSSMVFIKFLSWKTLFSSSDFSTFFRVDMKISRYFWDPMSRETISWPLWVFERMQLIHSTYLHCSQKASIFLWWLLQKSTSVQHKEEISLSDISWLLFFF